MKQKKLLHLLALTLTASCALVACNTQKKISNEPIKTSSPTSIVATASIATITATNPSNFIRTQEPLYFSLYDLGVTPNDAKINHLVAQENGKALPSQTIDTDMDGKADTLLVATNFTPAQTHNISIVSDASFNSPPLKKQTQAEISIKEGGYWDGKVYKDFTHFKNVQKFTPPPQYTDHSYFIRYEGPGIESDKVAYRVYLDWRNGFDIFGKKTNDMVLQNIGLDDYEKYHHNAPWGQDVLAVGKTLGAGGFGFWNGKSVDLVSKVKTWDATIVDNGALYSAFNIRYNQWQVNNATIDVSSTISMNAGSRLAHNHLELSLPSDIAATTIKNPKIVITEKIPNIAIGIVKHPNTTLLLGNEAVSGSAWTYAASWGKQSLSGVNDYLGMAVIFKRGDRELQTEDAGSYVTVMKNLNAGLDYYFVAVWSKELNGITTEAEFKTYLDQEVERLTKQTRIEIQNTLSINAKKKIIDATAALSWSKRLADSDMARKTFSFGFGSWDEARNRKAKFDYDMSGLHIMALQELNKVSPNPQYDAAAETVTGSFITDAGKIKTFKPNLFSIDLINPGRVLINLETSTHKVKYRHAVDFLRAQLKRHPRTSEGAFWHRSTYPNQLWLDGVYMGIPFLAQYAATYETGETQHESFKEAVHEFEISRRHLRDPKNGLYFHAWDESKKAAWADKKTGLASQYWARGSGWLAMAMVDVLDYLPESEVELRKTMIAMVNEFAQTIVRYQDPETGTWWQVLDKPNAIGNYHESTASAMYSYFLSKAVHKGYLSDYYKPFAEKAFTGLVNEFISVHPDGKISMNMQCQVAGLGFGRDGSYNYYMTEPIVSDDPKGNGPFILAGLETYKMLKNK